MQKNQAIKARLRIDGLKQALKAFDESVGIRDRLRYMFSQQEVAEKAALASRDLRLLKATSVQCEKFAESLYRQQQHQAIQEQRNSMEELKSRLKLLEMALKVGEVQSSSAMQPVNAKPRTLQSHWS
ncbi:hypothetical protein XPA_002025 [Xanthoria parietina]